MMYGSIDKKSPQQADPPKSRLVVARCSGEGEFGVTADGCGVLFAGEEDVQELGRGDGCTPL